MKSSGIGDRSIVSLTGGSILLVDDEMQVGRVTADCLMELGYDVVYVPKASDALFLIEEDPHRFQLVISDISMPGMSGHELANRIRGVAPHIKVMLMSGYIPDHHLDNMSGDVQFPLLQKPFNLEELSQRIASALESPSE